MVSNLLGLIVLSFVGLLLSIPEGVGLLVVGFADCLDDGLSDGADDG